MPTDTPLPDGTLFVPAEDLLLVEGITSYATKNIQIGEPQLEYGIILELDGRINHTDRHRTVSFMVSPEGAVALLGHLSEKIRAAAEAGAFA
jgi:hypothetical protein